MLAQGHLGVNNTPLYWDHLSTVTTVGWSMDHLGDTNARLYIRTTFLQRPLQADPWTTSSTCLQRPFSPGPLSGLYRQVLLYLLIFLNVILDFETTQRVQLVLVQFVGASDKLRTCT